MARVSQDRERNNAVAFVLVVILAIGVLGFVFLAQVMLAYALR